MSARFVHDTIVIGIPCYNEEQHIAETIASLRAQTHGDFLAVVLDNASTDGTEAAACAAIGDDPRFRYHRQPANIGAVANFQYLPDTSDSPFFMWLGGHDRITPDYLATHLAALAAAPGASLSHSHVQWIDDAGAPLRVSRAGDLRRFGGPKLWRYLRSVTGIGECTGIHGVIRRSMVEGLEMPAVNGGDNVYLSHLLYGGAALTDAVPRYERRIKAAPRHDYMQRMTGRAGEQARITAMTDAFRRDFEQLGIAWPLRPFARLALGGALRRGYGARAAAERPA